MNHSFRYTARDFTAELPAAAYVARFRDAERVGGYCRECGNYGRSWGCPPFGFDMEEYVTRYGTALLVATRITPEEPGLPVSEAGRLILPERQRLERRLLEMERQYGGRSFAYVGTCIHCPEGSCTLFGIEMKWGSGGRMPEYLTLVCGFFHDAESVVWNG